MRALILLLAALPALAGTDYTSFASGSCATNTNWTPNGVPGDGDRIIVVSPHAMTGCAITIGPASTNDQAGTGTVTTVSTAVTGTGTAFTSQLKVGMTIFISGASWPQIITAIADDTHATMNPGTSQTSKSFTFRDYAVWVKSGGSLTVTPSGTLTAKGDLNVAGTLTFTDATIDLYNATQHYRYLGGIGNGGQAGTLQAIAGSGRAAITASGGAYGTLEEAGTGAGNNIALTNTDLSNLGDASTAAITLVASAAAQNFKFVNCTFTNVGRVGSTAVNYGAASHITFQNNKLISLPSATAASYNWISLSLLAATTGARTFTNNVFAVPAANVTLNFGTTINNFTFTGNVLDRFNGPATGGAMTAFSGNLFYVRKHDNLVTWSFIGSGGDTLTGNYLLNDEGDGQENEHQVMSNDTPGVAGTWRLTNYILERSGCANWDLVHPGNPPALAVLFQLDHILNLPTSCGKSSGRVRWRGSVNGSAAINHNTLMGSMKDAGGPITFGGIIVGSEYAGYAGMLTEIKDNINWQSAAWSGTATGGFLATYDNQQGSPVAGTLTAAGVANNAHYNATTGTLYDAAGANGTNALGWNLFRQGTKPTLATDIDLGTGSDVRTQGPRFADATRNIATFDSAYLGNSATAWADAHVYVVGDIVSASTSTFYGGATINYRCTTAHTSDAASATNGKPGSAVTITSSAPMSGYRVNWEFASIKRIGDAQIAGTTITDGAIGCAACTYIQALSAWVRRGFVPQNPALWTSASDGTSIGAVDFSAKGKAMIAAIQ